MHVVCEFENFVRFPRVQGLGLCDIFRDVACDVFSIVDRSHIHDFGISGAAFPRFGKLFLWNETSIDN
jgi:hypothetical protein